MVFIIGGASRAGKSVVSQRLTKELGISSFPLDLLIGAIKGHDPNFASDEHVLGQPGQPFPLKAERLWPAVRGLIRLIDENRLDFVLEGDLILPKQIHEFAGRKRIKCCFMGFPEASVEQKVAELRKFRTSHLNWTDSFSPDEIKHIIRDRILFSRELREECVKYNIPFFDTSHNFAAVTDEVFKQAAQQFRQSPPQTA